MEVTCELDETGSGSRAAANSGAADAELECFTTRLKVKQSHYTP
jgi:hypothetical protein